MANASDISAISWESLEITVVAMEVAVTVEGNEAVDGSYWYCDTISAMNELRSSMVVVKKAYEDGLALLKSENAKQV